VVKAISGLGVRELSVHRLMSIEGDPPCTPRLLGSRRAGPDGIYAFLEWVPPFSRWPWRRTEYAALVLAQFARVHSFDGRRFRAALSGWDYEEELVSSAAATLEAYRQTVAAGHLRDARPMTKPLARLMASLPRIRRQLILFTGPAVIHGDAHPGNAVIRRSGKTHRAVLLDWGRSRLGSPLEDVSSWLQSLGFWEPAARRAHDSLLKGYLCARSGSESLGRQFREAYWLAGASNACAGALRYHFAVLQDPARSAEQRWQSTRAAIDWLRIIRRADACWSN
jgi:Ser/Thr protein kinase RdoA (MazF antagonist)